MKKGWLVCVAVAALAGWLSQPAEAHHGFASFDKDKTITVQGKVVDFHYVNPHSVVDFDVKDDQGKVKRWQGELTSPSHLSPKGWSATSLVAGDEVTVTGWAAKNGVPAVWITTIKLANGKVLKAEAGN